jgi:hypothetical protein
MSWQDTLLNLKKIRKLTPEMLNEIRSLSFDCCYLNSKVGGWG